MVMNDRPKYATNYAPGYRFSPTDEEIVVEYLLKKIRNQPIPIDNIAVVNFNDRDPDTLSGVFPPLGDNEWYFFTLRNRKHQNGSRPDRTTPGGFWKATVADKPISDSNGVIVGSKRSLKFFQGKPSNKPIKTDWIMHEFIAVVNQPSQNKRDANDNMKLDDFVMCRIHKKTGKSDNNRAEHRQPLPPPLENRDVPKDDDLSEEDWSNLFEDCWSPAVEEPPHGVLPLDHLPLPDHAPENRDVPSDDRLALAAPAPYVDLSWEYLPPSHVPQLEGDSSSSELTPDEENHWINFFERLRKEAQEPDHVPESSHGASSSYEFAGDEDYDGRSALKGVPTEEEEEQSYNGMTSSPPKKRGRHFYDQI